MFWGLKLENAMRYSQLVEKSFHISQATLSAGPGLKFLPRLVTVHAIVENTDYILCYLGAVDSALPPGNRGGNSFVVQQSLDLNISEGEEVVLYVEDINDTDDPKTLGASKKKVTVKKEEASEEDASLIVYLTGFFVEETVITPDLEQLLAGEVTDELDEDDLEDDEAEEEGDDEVSLTRLLFQDSLSDSDSDTDYVLGENPTDSLPPTIEEINDSTENKDAEVAELSAKSSAKKRKRARDERKATAEEEARRTPTAKRKKGQKSMDKKSEEKEPKTKPEKSKKQKKEKAVSFNCKGGTAVQELEIGTGKLAKPGKKLFVKYTGRLAHNDKIFDSNITAGRPFMFRLGQREVIQGWDDGLKGMRVGGKRKLTIPPDQGYGSRGAPPKIPSNAKLIFDIQLVDVK